MTWKTTVRWISAALVLGVLLRACSMLWGDMTGASLVSPNDTWRATVECKARPGFFGGTVTTWATWVEDPLGRRVWDRATEGAGGCGDVEVRWAEDSRSVSFVVTHADGTEQTIPGPELDLPGDEGP